MITQEKRAQFTKDLDKLVSSDYVIVPKKLTPNMMINALAVIATGIGVHHIELEVTKLWEKILEAVQEESL